MSGVCLELSNEIYGHILSHLLPEHADNEEACFALAKIKKENSTTIFQLFDLISLGSSDFKCQQGDYLELNHETRAKIIKKAHDNQASLIEFHSHPFPYPAEFSLADLNGLKEFVPHVWWRLKGRPYMAIVLSPYGYRSCLDRKPRVSNGT